MARKLLQIGYTRSRRYANYKGGRKYDENREIKERTIDEEKAESAAIFEGKWKIVREDVEYLKMKKEHQKNRAEILVMTMEKQFSLKNKRPKTICVQEAVSKCKN